MPDIEKGTCPATIEFGDDFGAYPTTFHCSLDKGHPGEHKEEGNMAYDEAASQPFRLYWSDILSIPPLEEGEVPIIEGGWSGRPQG